MSNSELQECFFYGNSMRELLRPGDMLLVRDPEPDERFAAGDVLCFQFPDAEVAVAHRVVRIIKYSEDKIAYITMGDNNDAPDARPVPENLPGLRLLVAAKNCDGVQRRIARGAAGMHDFRRNRLRRWCRRWLGRIWNRAERFAFWRIEPDSSSKFGAETVYYYHNMPVARRKANGAVVFVSHRYRLRFRIKPERPQPEK